MSVFLTPAPKKRIHRGWRFMSVHFKQGSQLDKSCFSVWLNQACTDKLNQMLMWARLPSETCMLWIVPLSAPTGPWDVLSLLRSLDVVKTSLPLPRLTRHTVPPDVWEHMTDEDMDISNNRKGCYEKDLLSWGNVIFVLIENFHFWAQLSKCFCCSWSSASQDYITFTVSLRLIGEGDFSPSYSQAFFGFLWRLCYRILKKGGGETNLTKATFRHFTGKSSHVCKSTE